MQVPSARTTPAAPDPLIALRHVFKTPLLVPTPPPAAPAELSGGLCDASRSISHAPSSLSCFIKLNLLGQLQFHVAQGHIAGSEHMTMNNSMACGDGRP